jgi:predicted transcriptional regulator
MIRPVILQNDLTTKVNTICKLVFGGVSDKELDILLNLLDRVSNNSVTITPLTTKSVTEELKISQTNLSTCIYRLEQKGVLARQGKTLQLHPVFNNIQSLEGLVIKFQ